MRDGFLRIETRIISRGRGQSVVEAAAYRTGLPLYDERTGTWHSFPDRDRIDLREIHAPDGAPGWASDWQALNNAIERGERRRDGQLAREFVVSLPHELTFEQGMKAIRAFVDEAFTKLGFVVQLASHGFTGDQMTGRRNWHVHIWVSLRRLIEGQWERLKERTADRRAQIDGWRQTIADRVNAALWAAGHNVQVHSLSAWRRDVETPNPVHKPYGVWRRGLAAAEAAGKPPLDDALTQLVKPSPARSLPPMTIAEPAKHQSPGRQPGMFSKLAGAIAGAGQRVAEAGRERSLAASARIEAELAAEEAKKAKARQAEAARQQNEAEWQQRDAEQRARHAREELLLRLRDEMVEKAGDNGPRAAFARAWKAEAARAILVDGLTIDGYGKAADRAAMRALVEAGGNSNDAQFMAALSPTTGLVGDPIKRLWHIGAIISGGTADPELKARFDATKLEQARSVRFDRDVVGRPRPQLIEKEVAPSAAQLDLHRKRQRGMGR